MKNKISIITLVYFCVSFVAAQNMHAEEAPAQCAENATVQNATVQNVAVQNATIEEPAADPSSSLQQQSPATTQEPPVQPPVEQQLAAQQPLAQPPAEQQAAAPTPAQELTPDEIIRRVDEVRSPQLDYTTTVRVTSYSPHGTQKSAQYAVMVKGKDKTIVKTELPQTERGRILLMRDNNLWAFFPDVSKPLRLSLQERLLGEVANGDIARVNFSGDYAPQVLRTEMVNEKDCYVLELIAKNGEVTYGRVILWAQKETFRPLKAEFYAVSGRLLKNCTYENYKMLADKMRPSELVMKDALIKEKKSTIEYDNIQVSELPEKYFSKEYMKRLME